LVIDPIHTEEDGLLNMVRGAQFVAQIVEVFPVRFPRVRWRQLVFPEEESKQRASQHLRGDVAAVVAVRQSREVDVAVDKSLLDCIVHEGSP
jgi:hypothetical protein